MIVTVCADKGSPGVSWTATVLGMVWPGERVLLEADPSGGDSVLRLRTPEGQLLARQPALRGLAVDARSGNLPTSLLSYAHSTSLGVPVIPATDMRTEDFALIARQWPAVASAADRWPGTVIADLGRLQEDSSAGPVAAVSTIVLLIARATPEGLYHLRERREVAFAEALRDDESLAATAEEYWPDMEGLDFRETVTDFELRAGTFFDVALVHLLTTATIDHLRGLYPPGRFEVRRFRPNIVVSTLPQGDLPKDAGILRTAAQHNNVNVGVYADVLAGGPIRRGDPVTLG